MSSRDKRSDPSTFPLLSSVAVLQERTVHLVPRRHEGAVARGLDQAQVQAPRQQRPPRAEHHGRDVPFAYNRKEAKDHGEGGLLVGAPLRGRVLIVDDVITAGTAIRESLALIRAAGAEPAGVLIALDREERGQGELSATQELAAEHGIPTVAIARLGDLLAYAADRPDLADHRPRLTAYRERYGVAT